ncbi:Protein SCO1, mitochondrial-like protein [Melia azedarach]|uniref:Protein SCO1, mitochondrial-like protein n=2 Tax=Melia azedarach TaxID=155640 RepID=A0ACC1XWH4_MELAZ|nr:Protein SCO1, mitochondrial-like protein [Melia azedarach]KAJ4715698.1 Protein SCO1, mitochondrial-like protein [Melia azedarach]
MPISRFLVFSSKQCSRLPLNLLRRFDQSKRIQCCNYTKSSRQSYEKPFGDSVMHTQTKRSRSWGAYVIPGVLLGFAGVATLFHYNDERRAVMKGQGQKSDRDTVQGPIIGGPFTLIDTEKRLVTERNFLGNWVLLYFGYTSSPDVGPEQVQIVARAIDTLELKQNVKILPVFVTIDPQRDTPVQLRAYLKEFDSRIVGLTGPAGAVRQMAQEYRVFFKKVEEEGDDYLIDSSHNMYLMNPIMEIVRSFGVEYTAEELAEEISKEVKKTSA